MLITKGKPMAIINALKILDKMEDYSYHIEQIVRTEGVFRVQNELSIACMDELQDLQRCQNQIKDLPNIKFARLNAGIDESFTTQLKNLFASVTNPIPHLQELNKENLEVAVEIIAQSRIKYSTAIYNIKKECMSSPLTEEFSKEELEKASSVFSATEDKLKSGNTSLQEIIVTLKEDREKAKANPVLDSSFDLKREFLDMASLLKNTENALIVLDDIKSTLINNSQTIVNHFDKQLKLENEKSIKEEFSKTEKFSQTAQRINALAAKYADNQHPEGTKLKK